MEALGRRRFLAVVALCSAFVLPAAGSVWHQDEWTDMTGRPWAPEDLQGKVVLIDFWATWCTPCLAELPNLRRIAERFNDDQLVIFGFALDAIERRDLRSFLLRHEITWPQIHEPRGMQSTVARHFDVEALPATLLIDSKGRIVARDLRGPALEAAIEALVDLAQ